MPYERTFRWEEPSFSSRAEALLWFEAERANLVAATHQAASLGFHAMAWQLPDALWSFFYLRSYWPDWWDTHRTGLAAARAAHNRQAEAWMMVTLADFDLELRQSARFGRDHPRQRCFASYASTSLQSPARELALRMFL